MQSRINNIFLKIIAACFMGVMVFFYSCKEPNTEQVEQYLEDQQLPDAMARNVRTLVSDSGRVKYRMITKEYQIYNDEKEPYNLFPYGLIFEGLTPQGEVKSSISCNYATYFRKNNLWELKDSVVAFNNDGDKFESDLIYWDQENEKVYTDKFVTITRGDEVMQGYGLDAKQDFSKYQIRDVSSVFYIEMDE